MGLFSVLTDDSANGEKSAGSSGSIQIPTVLQLYTGEEPIQLEEASVLSGYSALTYQAIQIGSSLEEEEVKNRHQTPDLGVWNCRVRSNINSSAANTKEAPLVDSLLATIATKVRVFCLTVDLSQPGQVEPSLTLLQTALVRHLIENPPTDPPETPERKTATTSLLQLQATEFGKASDDAKDETKSKTTTLNESFHSITTTLMICAKLPPLDVTAASDDPDAYKIKQAQTLVIYHLRKFAAALNCSLCFVEAPQPQVPNPVTPTASAAATELASTATSSSTTTSTLQPTADYNTLSQWWRDLALDENIWESTTSSSGAAGETPETVVVATSLYGPGKHQEDLIESVLSRSANYPGHWDASKDSLWVALPASKDTDDDDATGGNNRKANSGDEGWLGQLRESIASAQDLPPPGASSPEKRMDDDKKDGKDAEVSDFFASLLKKP
jgi:hypothetical protein